MILTSSLDPTGPKSSSHYLVLHYGKQRDLIDLPRSYSDLKKVVEQLYSINPNRFHVESKELNICAGERIKIPGELWSSIAELLGNVYIVQSQDDLLSPHPEAAPEPESSTNPIQPAKRGHIRFDAPLMNGGFLALTIGHIAFDADMSSSTKFYIQVQDEGKNNALTISTFPRTALTVLTSGTNVASVSRTLKELFSQAAGNDHHVIVHKEETRFTVMFDFHLVETVEASAHAPLTSIEYDLGTYSPFDGPVSADIYPDLSLFRSKFGLYRSTFKPIDRNLLYYGIVLGYPSESEQISASLDAIRREATLFSSSNSGAKWRRQLSPLDHWTDLDWDLGRGSVFLVRFNFKDNDDKVMFMLFGQHANYSLQVGMTSGGTVKFGEHNGEGKFEIYHRTRLAGPMLPGEHSVALVKHHDSGQIHAIFDFKQVIVVPRRTMADRKPAQMYLIMPGCSVEADVYDFLFAGGKSV